MPAERHAHPVDGRAGARQLDSAPARTVSEPVPLPSILTPARQPEALDHLRRYFGSLSEGSGWTGSRFERLLGGGDGRDVANRFTAADLVAVTTLSVDVAAYAAIQILETDAERFNNLLASVPNGVDLVDVDPTTIDEQWPAWRLWSELQALKGIGWVTAGKLLARKRPRLIPVYDQVVRDAVRPAGSFWVWLATALRADRQALYRYLLALREESSIGADISPLRVFDVVMWMEHRVPTQTAPEAGLRP